MLFSLANAGWALTLGLALSDELPQTSSKSRDGLGQSGQLSCAKAGEYKTKLPRTGRIRDCPATKDLILEGVAEVREAESTTPGR